VLEAGCETAADPIAERHFHAMRLLSSGRTIREAAEGLVVFDPRIAAKFDRAHFCYEAGPTGHALYRLIRSLGHERTRVAPSLISEKAGRSGEDEPPRCGLFGEAASLAS